MKNSLKSIFSLTVICAVIAVLLAGVNMITAPLIEKNQAAAANEALLIVMPDGSDFQPVDLTTVELPASVLEAYSEAGGGHVFKLTASGYGPDMIIMCGVDASGTVTGAVCLSSNETLGAEKTYGETLKGAAADTIESVATVSGATMTTENYRNAVKDALNSAIILGGGSVDIRSEEQILADNLLAALPTGDTFTEVFVYEALTDVSAVYSADNGAGFVYVTGEGEEALFVGVGTDGNKTGLELVSECFPRFRLVPGILLAPGYSSNPTVAAVLAAKAANINELFSAIALIDVPTDTVKNYSDVAAWKNNNNVTDALQVVCYPGLSLDGVYYNQSTQLAGLMGQVDGDNDDVPYVSPSNKNYQMTAAVLADGTEVWLSPDTATYLNGQGVVTALNFIGGWKCWGNRTAIYPASTDVKESGSFIKS